MSYETTFLVECSIGRILLLKRVLLSGYTFYIHNRA